jgi:hypothetical protein
MHRLRRINPIPAGVVITQVISESFNCNPFCGGWKFGLLAFAVRDTCPAIQKYCTKQINTPRPLTILAEGKSKKMDALNGFLFSTS